MLTQAEIDGDQLPQLELDLFFMLLAVAGNETTRNLISGAMVAFFDHPDQWERLRADRSLLPSAIEEMLRFVSPVMHFRRQATADVVIGDQKIAEGDKVVFWHISANRDETVFADPDAFDIARTPNNHMAFGGGGPHFCLGANLARMEIRVMFDRLLDRMPDIHLDGEVQRLRSNFINGVKHIPVAFAPSAPVGLTDLDERPDEKAGGLMRFHQAVTFLPTDEVLSLSTASDSLGYSGIYLSDHLFNPRDLRHGTRTRRRRTGPRSGRRRRPGPTRCA